MMTNRSYVRIAWRKQRLGLEMVNALRQNDFIYAEAVIEMVREPGSYCLVKHRDRHPGRAIAHHPGEVWGGYEEEGETVRIKVCLWPVGQKPRLDQDSGEPLDCLYHEYLLPREEFQAFQVTLTRMLRQGETFEMYKNAASLTPEVLKP